MNGEWEKEESGRNECQERLEQNNAFHDFETGES